MGNKFVREGSAKSFLEIYNELEDIEEAWRQKCESAGWTSRMDEDPRHQTGHASLSRPNGYRIGPLLRQPKSFRRTILLQDGDEDDAEPDQSGKEEDDEKPDGSDGKKATQTGYEARYHAFLNKASTRLKGPSLWHDFEVFGTVLGKGCLLR